MDITTRILNSISRIYDVTLEPEQWSPMLDELSDVADCVGCNLFVGDHTTSELTELHVSTQLRPALEYYLQKGYNRIEEAFLPRLWDILPERGFVKLQDAYQEFNRRFGGRIDTSELDKWMETHYGVRHIITSPLNFSPAFRDFVTFHMPEVSEKRAAMASIFLPHLAKVVEISRPFQLLKLRFNSVLGVLDRFHLGVLILSENGDVVTHNRAAQDSSDTGDGLGIRKNRLYCPDPDTNQRLQSAIAQVSRLSQRLENTAPMQLSIPRKSGKTPYLMEISALHHSEIETTGRFDGVLITLIDPDHRAIINTAGLELLFRLTPAEQHICKLLVDGLNTEEIAESRNARPETVRGQIKSLLSKTSSRQRSDLIKLALTINLPIDKKSRQN